MRIPYLECFLLSILSLFFISGCIFKGAQQSQTGDKSGAAAESSSDQSKSMEQPSEINGDASNTAIPAPVTSETSGVVTGSQLEKKLDSYGLVVGVYEGSTDDSLCKIDRPANNTLVIHVGEIWVKLELNEEDVWNYSKDEIEKSGSITETFLFGNRMIQVLTFDDYDDLVLTLKLGDEYAECTWVRK